MQCQTDEEHVELVKILPNTEAALLDWAINLMVDFGTSPVKESGFYKIFGVYSKVLCAE
ncbi:unnamed protein product [Lupinus luteus]|uniref:Uncharacterized protein n=1 Tax=Lupinus luteus TaxID=3873 RepID=A0AAV1YIA4_LUPLU